MTEMVTRHVKFGPSIQVPKGEIFELRGAPKTGKTPRAKAWMAEDPENRRVVDGGNYDDALALANQGYDVILVALPEHPRNPATPIT